jgi:hypothetical protein
MEDNGVGCWYACSWWREFTMQAMLYKMTAWMVAEFVLQLENMLMVRMHCILLAPCLGSQQYFFQIQSTEELERCTTATAVMPMLRLLKNVSHK